MIEHVAQETTVGARRGRTAGHAVPVLAIQERGGARAPAALRLGEVGGAYTLDNGDELQVACPQLVTEIPVDLLAVVFVGSVDRAQDVCLHARLREQLPAAHDHRVRSAPAAIETIRVVQLSWAVNGNPHEHVVVGEETRPFARDQSAVRLQGVAHALGGPTVEFTQLYHPLKEGEPPKGRFAALPEHRDFAVGA